MEDNYYICEDKEYYIYEYLYKGHVVYVGETQHLEQRIKQHESERYFQNLPLAVFVHKCCNKKEMDSLELLLINYHKPVFNIKDKFEETPTINDELGWEWYCFYEPRMDKNWGMLSESKLHSCVKNSSFRDKNTVLVGVKDYYNARLRMQNFYQSRFCVISRILAKLEKNQGETSIRLNRNEFGDNELYTLKDHNFSFGKTLATIIPGDFRDYYIQLYEDSNVYKELALYHIWGISENTWNNMGFGISYNKKDMLTPEIKINSDIECTISFNKVPNKTVIKVYEAYEKYLMDYVLDWTSIFFTKAKALIENCEYGKGNYYIRISNSAKNSIFFERNPLLEMSEEEHSLVLELNPWQYHEWYALD